VNCRQKAHWKQHQKACKKRAAELHEEKLFRKHDGHHQGDCPICFLPQPLDPSHQTISQSCCGKFMCIGCDFSSRYGSMMHQLCPFCRTPAPTTDEDFFRRAHKRMEAGDACAYYIIGLYYREGGEGYLN